MTLLEYMDREGEGGGGGAIPFTHHGVSLGADPKNQGLSLGALPGLALMLHARRLE